MNIGPTHSLVPEAWQALVSFAERKTIGYVKENNTNKQNINKTGKIKQKSPILTALISSQRD